MEFARRRSVIAYVEWTHRPGAWCALAFAVGIIASQAAQKPLTDGVIAVGCLMAIGLLVASALRLSAGKGGWADVALLAVICCAGALRHHSAARLLPANHIVRHPGLWGDALLRGYIEGEVVSLGEKTRFVLSLADIEVEEGRYSAVGRILVTVHSGPVDVRCADFIEVEGRLRHPSPTRNPRGFDYRAYLAERGIDATLSLRSTALIRHAGARRPLHWSEHLVLPMRRLVRDAVRNNLRGERAGLLLGLLLGEKERIADDVRADFRKSGLAHVLVVSGMHVGIIALIILNALYLLPLPRACCRVMTMVFLLFYALLTQLYPPVMRAVLVACIVLGGALVERDVDAYNALGWAALIIMILWPLRLLGLSFQLSFVATLAMVALHGPLIRLLPDRWCSAGAPLGRFVMQPLCVSLAAQLATVPILALHFQEWAPIGLGLHLLVAPLLAVALALGLVTVGVYAVDPLLSLAFNGANYWVLGALISLVEQGANGPGSLVDVPRPDIAFLVFFALLLILVPFMASHRAVRKMSLLALLVWLNIALWSYVLRDRTLEVFFLDVGQGDAAVVRMPNGRVLVVDGGQRSTHFDYGARVLRPFLSAHNIRHVDVVVASHPHSDHVGGLVALLESVSVGHYVDSGQVYDSWTARRLHALINERGIVYHRAAAGDRLQGLGDVEGLVLHPSISFVDAAGDTPRGVNNGSIVLKLRYGTVEILLTGDVERETDRALLAWGEHLQADVLKVAHHGSSTSSSLPFIRGVGPQWAIISVGTFNRFGHPADSVLRALCDAGAQVVRTDLHGAIRLRSDGANIAVSTTIEPSAGGFCAQFRRMDANSNGAVTR